MALSVLTDQSEASAAFHKWISAIEGASKSVDFYREIEGTGIVYSNYGKGKSGKITTQVMFGADSAFKDGIVKIVVPNASEPFRKKTEIFKNNDGRIFITREGSLQKNNLSNSITSDFEALSSLRPFYETQGQNPRKWFLVADLSTSPDEIVRSTVEFVLGCARARHAVGGGSLSPGLVSQSYGMDERGGVYTVSIEGGTKEIERMQGYVWERLKNEIGDILKPANGRFCVDGIIGNNGALIEIKTGTSADTIYTAIGQLMAYPNIITNIPKNIKKILLVPETPTINPLLPSALSRLNIGVYTYRVKSADKNQPIISFSDQFIKLCRSLIN